LAEELDQNEF